MFARLKKTSISIFILLLLLFVVSVEAFAVIPTDSPEDIEITKYIQSRNYEKAIETIEKSFSKLEPKDYYLYTLGNAYYLNKNYEKATSTLDRLIAKYPDSTFYTKAVLKKIWALFNQDKLLDAYLLYKERLEHLLSDERRFTISNVYLELARKLTEETEEKKPTTEELKTAVSYFNKAIEIGIAEEEQDKVYYELAYSSYEINKYDFKNINLFDKVITGYPESEYVDDSIYYTAKIYENSSYLNEARKHYAKLYTDYPESEHAPTSIYYTAVSYGLYKTSSVRNLELCANLIQKLFDKYPYPESDYSKWGLYDIAMAYSNFSSYESKAIDMFRKFVKKYGEEEIDLSAKSLIAIGNIYQKRNDYDNAEKVFKEFIKKYPEYKEWKNIQSRLITLDYIRAYNSYKEKDYAGAIKKFHQFTEKYPIDSRNPEIMYLIGDVYYQQEEWQRAVDEWQKVVNKYPNTTSSAKAQYYIGVVYEEELGKLKEAKEAYEQVKGNYSYQQMAQERINTLTRKELNLVSDKMFTTNDEPYVSLGTRNIDAVAMKVYKLDLKEYFISKKGISSIENLDVVLIKPDFDFEVNFGEEISESYEDYRYFDSQINIPFDEPGAYVVYAESKLYKSSVLFLVSDIAMTVKSTKEDAIIHVKNLKTETSENNAELMITDGNNIVEGYTTDEEGFVKLNLEKLQEEEGLSPYNLQYFAYKGNQYSSSSLYTGSIYSASKSETASYIFTDKDQYKPGDKLYYKAILRNINQGVIEPLEDKEFTITITTTKEGQIYKTTTTANEYGTVFGVAELPDVLSTSYNRATLTIKSENHSFSKYSIPITVFKPAEKEINVDFDKIAYKLGETMKVSFSGRYLSGAPTSNVEIQYFIQDSWETLTLNEKGEGKIELSSSTFPDSDSLQVSAKFSDSPNLTFSGTAFIILKEFSIELKKSKELYLPNEKASISIFTKNYLDKPISQKLNIRLSRTSEETGIKSEINDGIEIETDSNGKYTFEYGDDTGSLYQMVVEGVGENGIPVSNSISFRIISEEGGNQIEILPESLTFKVGETKPVKVYSKIEGGLALFTVERAKILEYKLVTLSKGVNSIDVSVTETYAPNSVISIAIVKQGGFYHSSREISIESGIDVDIATDKESYKPSDEVELTLNTKNVYGDSVPSEVMVAVVDDAVLKATNTTYEDVKSAFYKILSLNYVTQTGSTPFTYYGIQKEISKDLLAELDRRDYDATIEIGKDYSPDDLYKEDKRNGYADAGDGLGGSFYAEPEESEEEIMLGEDIDNIATEDGGFADTTQKPGYSEKDKTEEESALRVLLKDTAFFKADVNTDKNGKAQISFKLPDNLTRWNIFVIANNKRSLFGMESKKVISTRDLVVNIDAPLELTEGDEFSFNVSLQNNTEDDITQDVKIGTLLDGKVTESESKEIRVNAKTSKIHHTKTFTTPDKNISLIANAKLDGEKRDVSVKKWATTHKTGLEGFTDRTVFRYLKLSEDIVNKGVDKKLFVEVLPATSEVLKHMKDSGNYWIFGAEAYAESLITAVNYYKYLVARDTDDAPAIDEVKREINSLISILELWGRNGYWTFSDDPTTGSINYNVTAIAYFSLASAKKQNFDVSESLLNRVSKNLLSFYSQIEDKYLEQKLIISFALSVNRKIDYSQISTVFNYNSLSTRGLALLSLTLNNLGRTGDANEINDIVLERVMESDLHQTEDVIPYPDYISNWHLVQALGLYAVLQTKYLTPEIEERINLLASYIDSPYKAPNFLTFASLMYHKYLTVRAETSSDFLLTIEVNGEQIFKERINESSQLVKVFSESIKDENKVEINIEGNKAKLSYEVYAEYSFDDQISENVNNKSKHFTKVVKYPKYTVEIDGKTYPIDKNYYLLSVEQDEASNNSDMGNNEFNVNEEYIDNNVSNAFGMMNQAINFEQFTVSKEQYRYDDSYDIEQEASKVPLGTVIPIELSIDFTGEDSKYSYFILEDHIPAGFTYIEGSMNGADAVKRSGNHLVFFISENIYQGYTKTLSYEIKAKYKGRYRSLPPKYYNSRHQFKEIVEEANSIEVLNKDYNLFADYKLSPYELYPLGLLYFEHEKYDEAEKYLSELFDNWSLNAEYKKATVYALMKIAIIEDNKPKRIVHFYEILRDKFSETKISLDDMKAIADAYNKIDEGEKAYYLIESLYKAHFGQEFDLALTLFNEKQYQRSYDTANDILMDYPDLPTVKNGLYSYSQALYYHLGNLERTDRSTTEDGETLLSKFLYNKTYNLLTDYLTLFPSSFNADEISFVLMNLFFDTNRYESAYQSGELFVNRFPESQYLDDYYYLSGLALFSDDKTDDAMEYLKKVAYDQFKTKDGISKDSENKFYALRLIAQVYHSKDDIDKAIEIYKDIKNSFSDVKRAIEILEEKVMDIDDVIEVPMEEEAILEVKHKNIGKITAKIYKVDFVILALTERNLSDITKVDLSGIKPLMEKEYDLDYERGYLPAETEITLPIEDKGAYLLVVRSEVGERSSIILKSDLRMDVLETTDGNVRVTVTDINNRFIQNMKMYFKGTNNDTFKITKTDLRGMAQISGITGNLMIIGDLDGEYVFYRSKKYLSGDNQYRLDTIDNLKNITSQNRMLQEENIQQLQTIVTKDEDEMSINEIYNDYSD
jgi:TolA-binding protein